MSYRANSRKSTLIHTSIEYNRMHVSQWFLLMNLKWDGTRGRVWIWRKTGIPGTCSFSKRSEAKHVFTLPLVSFISSKYLEIIFDRFLLIRFGKCAFKLKNIFGLSTVNEKISSTQTSWMCTFRYVLFVCCLLLQLN